MNFYIGLHQPWDAHYFDRSFISVNRLWKRKSNFAVNQWVLDSGAFTEISKYGEYRHLPATYAQHIRRWVGVGQLNAAVSQDYMCEPWILKKWNTTVKDHQYKTIRRYDALCNELEATRHTDVPLMPVLQGYSAADYVWHVRAYGSRLYSGMWVGVGSVCKRNSTDPKGIEIILSEIKERRPDLRLHGFGLKKTALLNPAIRDLLHSADSMAWSFAARIEGRSAGANDWREAKAYEAAVLAYG